MSVSTSIEINLSKPTSGIAILKKLKQFGWTYNDQGKVTYLPVGDEDDFNWRHEYLPLVELDKILALKDEHRELIGVALTWKESNIGGHFLVNQAGKILISPDINRKVLDINSNNKITDMNWYITKLIPAFGQLYESISIEEHV